MEEQLALEQRVWQRVRGLRSPETDLEESLEALIRLGREQRAAMKGRSHHLFSLEGENLALLTALYHLRFGKRVSGQPSGKGNCRQRAEQMLRLYVQLENHRDLGPLFTDLTRRQRAVCAALEHHSHL